MPWCYNPFFGSSPRVRGKQIARLRFHEQGRIIPARAGQTRACRRCHPPFPDHPRACGANGAQQGKQVGSAGSSPRVRGKRPCVGIGRRPRRIIPARAGQTMIVRIGLMTVSDHPRACGANMGMTEKLKDKYGSSPRVRGKQSDFMRKLLSAGPSIIGFAQWLQSSCYCSCFQSSAKTPISRGTTPTSLFLGFQNSITLLLLT